MESHVRRNYKTHNTMFKTVKKIAKSILTKKTVWKGSADYWENRYKKGGNSGAGSYNSLASFKAEVINSFIKQHQVNTVIEWGCGDGSQLLLMYYPDYYGIDISETAVEMCKNRFRDDPRKHFYWSGVDNFSLRKRADIALSLDVIYHLVEDDVFEKYMKQLFESAEKYVCIYSCNDNDENSWSHIKHRKFTDWIDNKYPNEWQLISLIKNKYPYDKDNLQNTSWSDFYFYERIR